MRGTQERRQRMERTLRRHAVQIELASGGSLPVRKRCQVALSTPAGGRRSPAVARQCGWPARWRGCGAAAKVAARAGCGG